MPVGSQPVAHAGGGERLLAQGPGQRVEGAVGSAQPVAGAGFRGGVVRPAGGEREVVGDVVGGRAAGGAELAQPGDDRRDRPLVALDALPERVTREVLPALRGDQHGVADPHGVPERRAQVHEPVGLVRAHDPDRLVAQVGARHVGQPAGAIVLVLGTARGGLPDPDEQGVGGCVVGVQAQVAQVGELRSDRAVAPGVEHPARGSPSVPQNDSVTASAERSKSPPSAGSPSETETSRGDREPRRRTTPGERVRPLGRR